MSSCFNACTDCVLGLWNDLRFMYFPPERELQFPSQAQICGYLMNHYYTKLTYIRLREDTALAEIYAVAAESFANRTLTPSLLKVEIMAIVRKYDEDSRIGIVAKICFVGKFTIALTDCVEGRSSDYRKKMDELSGIQSF